MGEGPEFCQRLRKGHLSHLIYQLSLHNWLDSLSLTFRWCFCKCCGFFLWNSSHISLSLPSTRILRWRTQNQSWRPLLHLLNASQADLLVCKRLEGLLAGVQEDRPLSMTLPFIKVSSVCPCNFPSYTLHYFPF